jgi:hypothetical protein
MPSTIFFMRVNHGFRQKLASLKPSPFLGTNVTRPPSHIFAPGALSKHFVFLKLALLAAPGPRNCDRVGKAKSTSMKGELPSPILS